MNPTAAQAVERVRAIAVARATGEGAEDLSVLTEALLEATEAAGEDALLPVWAACRCAEDDALVQRALSFVVARKRVDLGADRWIPLLWLLASPRSHDLSTMRNCVTALQRQLVLSGTALRMLRGEVGPFLIHALRFSVDISEQATDLLFAYVDSGVIEHLFTARTSEVLRGLLAGLPESVPSAVSKSASSLAAEMAKRTFPDEFPSVLEDLRAFLGSRVTPQPTDEWSKVLHWTDESVRDFVEHYEAFEDLTAVASARNVAAHDLRVTGRWASVGKLPLDFLEKLLHTWRRLYTDVRAKLSGDGEAPTLFALAPARGSFVVRVLVDVKEPQLELDAKSADEIVTSSELLAEATTVGTAAYDYAPLWRLAADQDVNLEIGIAVPGPTSVRHRIRFGYVRARRIIERIAAAPAPPAARTEMVGTLDGANHRTGKFEMAPQDGRPAISGSVVRGGHGLLLDKTIGETYRFDLGRTTDGAGTEKWELFGLTPLRAEAAADTRITREVLAPIPETFTSAVVPKSDSLARIIQVVEVVASGKVLSPATIDLSQRHVDYHKHAARVLHLLSDEGTLLPAGATLVALPSSRRYDHLAIQFEVSTCGQAWMKWAGVARVADLDPETAFEFLEKKSNLTDAMIKRRGRTLRRWARDLGSSSKTAEAADQDADE